MKPLVPAVAAGTRVADRAPNPFGVDRRSRKPDGDAENPAEPATGTAAQQGGGVDQHDQAPGDGRRGRLV